MIVEIDPSIIRFYDHVQDWCRNPYPKHPNGCPNYNSEQRSLRGIRPDLQSRVIRECPPTVLIDGVLRLSEPVYVIYTAFEVGKDAEQRRQTSEKLTTPGQWYNIRYWQPKARKKLYGEVERFLDDYPGSIVDLCPEAHGVNLFVLMKELDIKLRWGPWPPEHSIDNIVYQVALGGYTC